MTVRRLPGHTWFIHGDHGNGDAARTHRRTCALAGMGEHCLRPRGRARLSGWRGGREGGADSTAAVELPNRTDGFDRENPEKRRSPDRTSRDVPCGPPLRAIHSRNSSPGP